MIQIAAQEPLRVLDPYGSRCRDTLTGQWRPSTPSMPQPMVMQKNSHKEQKRATRVKDSDTGEEYIDIAETCGGVWWANFHSLAKNIRDYGCSTCGDFAVKMMQACHDLVNIHLAGQGQEKKIHYPDNLREFASYFHEAIHKAELECLICKDIHSAQVEFIPTTISGLATGLGFALGGTLASLLSNAILKPKQEEGLTLVEGQGHLSPEAQSLDISGKGEFIRERIKDPSAFDENSFRTKVVGDHRLVIGCPKGQWSGIQCDVGTEVQTILHPRGEEDSLTDIAIKRGITIYDDNDIAVASGLDITAILQEIENSGVVKIL